MTITNRTAVRLLLATVVAASALAQTEGARLAAPQQPAAPGTAPKPTTLHEAWQLALSTMRAHKAPGLVFVLPPAGDKADPDAVRAALAVLDAAKLMGRLPPIAADTAREQMLLQLQALRNVRARPTEADPTPREQWLPLAFGLAVPVVATAAQCGARDGETLLLLRADGARLAGFAVDLGDPKAVTDALAPHLWSEEALAVRQAALPPDLREAERELVELRARATASDADDAARMRYRERLLQLQERLYSVAPALVRAVRGTVIASSELRGWLDWTTPLGTEVGQTWDPCPACGMMATPPAIRSTLKLLAE